MTPRLPPALAEWLDRLPVESFAAGAPVVAPDAAPACVYWLRDGLVRLYSIDDAGREFNHGFHAGNEWVFGRLTLRDGRVCCSERAIGVTALQLTHAVGIGIAQLESMSRDSPEVGRFVFDQMLAITAERLGREADLVQQSAEQRYQELLRRKPSIDAEVAQHQIAAWLGVTPVALSRIRRRIRSTGTRDQARPGS